MIIIKPGRYVGYGWGQVQDDGFGVAYMVKNQSMHFNLGSKASVDGVLFKHYFGEALEDMKVVFGASIPVTAKL